MGNQAGIKDISCFLESAKRLIAAGKIGFHDDDYA